MRLSRPDENDSSKRRHFEISIDSPFNILSCRATQANTSLPAYDTGDMGPVQAEEFDCGCPGAALRRRNSPPTGTQQAANATSRTNPPQRSWTSDTAGLTMPTQAHVHHDANTPQAPRPMHLLRAPSFNPPAFDDDEPPPPLVTPPPHYENIISGDTDHALADYFARLADEGVDDDRDDRSRMDHPLTPGGRVYRSMDVPRTWAPLVGAIANESAVSIAATGRDTPVAR